MKTDVRSQMTENRRQETEPAWRSRFGAGRDGRQKSKLVI
jgi:hypothetical protein